MTLGEKLKMLRASRGLSQEQLAAELNVSRQAVSKWECGDAAPDLDKLRAICTYFAVTTDYLIWENEEDTPKAAVPEKERAVRGRNEVFQRCAAVGAAARGHRSAMEQSASRFCKPCRTAHCPCCGSDRCRDPFNDHLEAAGQSDRPAHRRDRRSFGALPIGSYACLPDGSVVRVEIVCRRRRLADRLGERGDLAAA